MPYLHRSFTNNLITNNLIGPLLEHAYFLSKDANNHKVIQKQTRFNEDKIILHTDIVRTDIYKRSYFYKCRIIWNNLPPVYHHFNDLVNYRAYVKSNIESIYLENEKHLKNNRYG